MGRYITCDIGGDRLSVWKYAFGRQPSEMGKIHKKLRIGKYFYWYRKEGRGKNDRSSVEYSSDLAGAEGDVLVLHPNDVQVLNRHIEEIRAYHPSENYVLMVEHIRDFMLRYHNQKEFVFVSEF